MSNESARNFKEQLWHKGKAKFGDAEIKLFTKLVAPEKNSLWGHRGWIGWGYQGKVGHKRIYVWPCANKWDAIYDACGLVFKVKSYI